MKIIVGLGNPGDKFNQTRHNVGYMFVDALAKCAEIIPVDQPLSFRTEKKFDAEIAETLANGEKIILSKPTTFMNLSGGAVNKLLQYYKAKPSDLIVISDDIDLPIGYLRVRKEGGSGGHKGLGSIIEQIKNDAFARFRIGISEEGAKVNRAETNRFVLGEFSQRELPVINKVIDEGIDFLVEFIGKEQEIPCRSFKIVAKEEKLEKEELI